MSHLQPSFLPAILPWLAICSLLPAQTWNESGDAGSLPATAQVASGNGALTALNGIVSSDADLFLIQIDSPTTFSATVVAGTLIDTQLFLFDEFGHGVVANDDANGLLSAITPGTVKTPGRYYLGISSYDHDPVSVVGEIWLDYNTSPQQLPDGFGRRERIVGWAGGSTYSGSYFIALTGAAKVGQQVMLPDLHHLSESVNQIGGDGSPDFFTTGGGTRFQLLYEGSHFVSAGVTGPITLTRLLFRGEEGEPNPITATWSNATLRIARTSRTAAGISTTFLTNLAAPTSPATTVTTAVTMQPSQGSTPNNSNVVIDLQAIGATLSYDPTGSQPNLLIDLTLPSAPAMSGPGGIMAMQDASGGVAVVRGMSVVGTASASGGVYDSPLVLAVEFTGGTGGSALLVPARNEAYGAACGGSPASFYQAFVNGQSFDLTGLRLTPDSVSSPTCYTVTSTANPIDLTKIGAMPISTADEEIVTVMPGFNLHLPGQSLNTLRASTNGFVWFDIATTLQDFTPNVTDFLGVSATGAARVAPFWYDFHCGRNVATHPNSGLHGFTDYSGGSGNYVCYITWKDVGLYNSTAAGGIAAYSMQCVFHQATGEIEFRYGAMPRFCCAPQTALPGDCAGLVGFTRGLMFGTTPSVDPQSRDLSVELPFTTAVEGSMGNLGLTASTTPFAGGAAYGGRLFPGQTVRWNVGNVPPTALLGVQLVDIAPARPGIQVPTITAPGCMLSTTTNALLWELDVAPTSIVTGTHGFTVPPGFDGTELHAQYVVLNGLFGGPDLITQASNALMHTVGRR